jgi:hypothetical protein
MSESRRRGGWRERQGSGLARPERELVVVAAVVSAGFEKAAAHGLGLSHSTVKHHLANARPKVGATRTAQLVWRLAPRLPEPDEVTPTSEPHQALIARSTLAASCIPSALTYQMAPSPTVGMPPRVCARSR